MSVETEPMFDIEQPTPAAGRSAAVERANRIRDALAEIIANRDLVMALIREAREQRDASALGYSSWTAYVAVEFADMLADLEIAERRSVVLELRESGMSQRAIGSVMGVDHRTVGNDLRAATGEDSPVGPITGVNGKTYTPLARPVEPAPVEPVRDEPAAAAFADFKAASETSNPDAVLAKWRINFHKTLEPALRLTMYDPDEAADRLSDDVLFVLESYRKSFDAWHDKVKNRGNGLRIVKGEQG